MVKQREPNNVDRHVGNRILLRRKQLKISQERLGIELGVSFQQVQKYERGTNRVGCSRLWEICRALKVEPSYFFEGLKRTEEQKSQLNIDEAEQVQVLMSSNYGISMALALSKIRDGSVKANILKMVRTIADSMNA